MLDKSKPYGTKAGTCASCGMAMWRGSTSLPEGQARCLPCRRANPPVARRQANKTNAPSKVCVDCSTSCWGVRCRPCHDADVRAQARGRDLDLRCALARRRAARMRQAPGLTARQYRKLRAKWMQQKRACSYCPAPATTVDHVIPVALGGTSHEGNLTPCCRSCNMRKSDSLLIEWKLKRRVKRERVAVMPSTPRSVKGKTCKVCFPKCERCDVAFAARSTSKRFCSERCLRGRPEVHHCADCGVVIERKRRKCDACIAATKRVRRREERRRYRQTEAYKAQRKRRDQGKRAQHGGAMLDVVA